MAANSGLFGKTAFVAGASGGINLGIAHLFALNGANVVLISRSKPKIEAAAALIDSSGNTALGLVADVRDMTAVETAYAIAADRYGQIDFVISGAAGNFKAPAIGMSSNAFKTVVDIDLVGTFNVFRASFLYLRKPGASLIAITAPQGSHPEMFQAHACAAKAGVNMLTKCLAMEWGPAGVRVNGISPGPITGTEGVARLAADPRDEAVWRNRLALREFGNKDDIAELALFLCSPQAKYVTGAIIDCDGGSGLGDASADALIVPNVAS